MKRFFVASAAALLMAVTAIPVQADVFARLDSYNTVSNAGVMRWTERNALGGPNNTSATSHFDTAGFPLKASAVVNGAWRFNSFCIQLNQQVAVGSTYQWGLAGLIYSPIGNGGTGTGYNGGMMDTTMANSIRALWKEYVTDGGFTDYYAMNSANYGTPGTNTNNANSAKMQRVIWAILGELGTGEAANFAALGGGEALNAPAPGALVAGSSERVMYNWAKQNYNNGDYAVLMSLINENRQDQIVELKEGYNPPGDVEVPLPAGFGLMLTGIIPMFATYRLRRNKVATA